MVPSPHLVVVNGWVGGWPTGSEHLPDNFWSPHLPLESALVDVPGEGCRMLRSHFQHSMGKIWKNMEKSLRRVDRFPKSIGQGFRPNPWEPLS